MTEDLVLMRDVKARYALREQPLRYRVVSPYGAWLGQGALRVLRARSIPDEDGNGEVIELTVGYEGYERFQ